MNKLVYSVFCITLCFSVSSCSFHKRVAGKRVKSIINDTLAGKVADTTNTKNENHTIAQSVAVSVKDTVSQLPDNTVLISQLTPLWNARFKFSTFSGKAKIHFEAKENEQEFTANFRIKKDSVIWMAITAMGGMVQAARVFITPDSFRMINYLEKEVISLSLRDVGKILPTSIDFASLQNLILGEPLRSGVIYDAINGQGTWSIEVKDTSYTQHITYSKTDTTMIQGMIRTINPNGPQAILEYGEYENIVEKKISTKRVMNIQNGGDIISVDVKFQNANFDLPLEFPFVIPKNYTGK